MRTLLARMNWMPGLDLSGLTDSAVRGALFAFTLPAGPEGASAS